MSSITVDVRELTGTVSLHLPEGATVADAREAAELNDGLAIRAGGQQVSREDEGSYELRDEEVIVATPPAAKHGTLLS